MITARVFEGEDDLGLHAFLSVPRIGDKLTLYQVNSGLDPYNVVAVRHFPMAVDEEGGKPEPEVWVHVEFDI